MSEHGDPADRIAVVGMAGRFPKAAGVEELWRNLRDGVEAVRFFSDEELLEAGVSAEQLADPSYVRGCMYLDDADRFDAAFFDVNPREAELTDPQQRVFLECAWEALENASIDPSRYPGQIAVFAGSGRNNYLLDNVLANRGVMQSMGVVAAALQNEKDFLSSRVAYKFNLKGPAVTVQSACSTSLVALHLGSQALLSGECDAVLAGGVCIAALRKQGYPYVDGGIFSRDGHLYAFDARASGQVGGNGCAIVVLKRLEDALAERDTIHAVIRGSALNNDGIQKVSFSAPGVDGQARVIVEALAVAGVHPEQLDYVECHGTGTQLGDPIEVAALTQAFRTRTQRRGFCPIGSLKTNVGHLDAAAGVAGLIKTALALRHEALPPSLNYESPNPEIDFETSPFFVNTELRSWKRGERPRICGVSSFGMGGTNAHVVVEEPPPPAAPTPSQGLELLPLSARNRAALEAMSERLARHLESTPRLGLADVTHTLQVGRKALELRKVVLAHSLHEAVEALRTGDSRHVVEGRAPKGGRSLALCFSGQGSQYAGMTRGLYEGLPTFRSTLDRVCQLFLPHLEDSLDLRVLLYPAPADQARADEALRRTQLTQPALFAVELALASQLAAWGIRADAMIGHSIGEYVAACLAGVLTLEDACRLVAVRGRLIGGLPAGGAMLAVQLAEAELRERLSDELSIAAVNAPGLCVASGPEDAIAVLETELAEAEVSTRRLHTSHAFHSSLMDPILEAFEDEVRATPLAAPRERFVSCTSGTWIRDDQATDPAYWVRHLREAVRFSDGVRTLLADKPRALLEVGPGRSLTTLARLSAPEGTPLVASTRHPQEEHDDEAVLLRAVASLWAAGVSLDWEALHPDSSRNRLPLPGYAFQRERFWVEPDPPERRGALGAHASREKKADMSEWFYAPAWRSAPDAGARRAAARWLVFGGSAPGAAADDDGGVSRALLERLAAEGREAVLVERGAGFEVRGEHGYAIDARNPADYADLFEALAERGFEPDTLCHLWSLEPVRRDSLASLEEAQEAGFYSLLFLAQALAGRTDGQGAHGELRLGIVTRGTREVLGGDLDQPEQACVLGAAKAIDSELSDVACTALDLDAARGDEQASRIVAELTRARHAPEAAWRGSTRWVPDFTPLPLEPPPAATPLVRPGAVVLVTGGLGGIGLSLAERLAEAGAKLVLVGRSPLPPEEAWDAWTRDHGREDPTTRKIDALRGLRRHGGQVLALSADVADPEAMRAVLETTRERLGAPSGVVHAAGLPGAGLIELKSRAAARKVLAPKVRGTQVLAELLADTPLDFFVLCSSLATAIVGVGQADYFAANAYLDAWATWARRHGIPATSIGWDAWREVGMAVQTVVPEALRAEREENLKTGIAPQEGREAFVRILAAGLPHVFVSTRDLFVRVAEIAEEVRSQGGPQPEPAAAASEEPSAPRSSSLHERPALATPYAAPQGSTEETLALLWGDLLGIEGVGRDDDVFDLGGNSLLLMQLSVRIRSGFGVNLPLRSLFELKTVASLGERVDTLRMASEAGPGASGGAGGSGEEDTEEVTL